MCFETRYAPIKHVNLSHSEVWDSVHPIRLMPVENLHILNKSINSPASPWYHLQA